MSLAGFGNHHASEAIPGALPTEQNSPQCAPFGLYAEQLNGSAFTQARALNLHSWLYRALPSTVHYEFSPYPDPIQEKFAPIQPPNPLRWSPRPNSGIHEDFLDGLLHIAGTPLANTYLYQCNQSMITRYCSDQDGELLFVPYLGALRLHTEMGSLDIAPGMIAVIPRGIYFKIELKDITAAGYLCENRGAPFSLPELGIIGANGLAHPRHFIYPEAAFEKPDHKATLVCKSQQHWWIAKSDHSPLNVVAWHGNYAPYSYDLSLFNALGTVSFDHPDPCIFTVLTSQSDVAGVANLDFVIFPPRWMVADHTFRPPYFHRNIMSEFMGLVKGLYDAKEEGFEVGGISVHNAMVAHGPDSSAYNKASTGPQSPDYYKNTLAFMFESRDPWRITETALKHASRQRDYPRCWADLKQVFLL